MTRRTNHFALPLVVLLFLTFFVAVANPAHAFVDKDCGDFSSQKAAQIFYLKQGGPQKDPHGLDADDDGKACDSNPCPCYYGSQVPGDNPPAPPPPVRSKVNLNASRTSGITGERVTFVANVSPKLSRPVVLQRKAGKRWVRVDSGKTNNDGRWSSRTSVRRSATSYRAVISAVKNGGRKYTAATSDSVTVKTLAQAVSLQLSDGSVGEGERVIATVTAKPVRAKRPVVLQQRRPHGWIGVEADKVNRAGEARFVVDTASDGTFRYRAVVQRFRGAVPARSRMRALEVLDTTPPGVPSGLVATAGNGSVNLDWSNVGAGDLRGYHVFSRTTPGGAWTQLTSKPVGTSEFTASGLVNGTTYNFCIRSVDMTGNRSACSASASATPTSPPDTTAPAAPTGLSATAGDGYVDLDWEDVTAADFASYRVYMASSAEGPWTLVNGAVAASTYRAEGLTNGTQYFFKVTAVDASGNESGSSAVVSGTPTAPAPAPVG